MLHDEFFNPWHNQQKPKPEDTLLRMHHGNCDKPNRAWFSRNARNARNARRLRTVLTQVTRQTQATCQTQRPLRKDRSVLALRTLRPSRSVRCAALDAQTVLVELSVFELTADIR